MAVSLSPILAGPSPPMRVSHDRVSSAPAASAWPVTPSDHRLRVAVDPHQQPAAGADEGLGLRRCRRSSP